MCFTLNKQKKLLVQRPPCCQHLATPMSEISRTVPILQYLFFIHVIFYFDYKTLNFVIIIAHDRSQKYVKVVKLSTSMRCFTTQPC